MRFQRYGFIFLACFLVLISGAYYYQVAALRMAHHVVVTLALLGYTLWAWRRGGIPASPLALPLLAAILLWMAAAALGVDARVGLENAWFPISHAVIALCLIDLIRRGRGGLVVETQFLLAAAVALFALVHLGSWYFGWGVVPGTAVGWAEVTAVAPLPLVLPMIYMPLGVSTWLAAYTAPLVLLSFAYGLSGRGASRGGLWALAAALLIALLATGSRGGLIALAAGAAAFVGLRVLPLSFLPLTPRPPQGERGQGGEGRDDRSQGGEERSPLRRFLPLAAAALIVAAALIAVYLIGGSAARFTGDALRFELWRGALAVGADHPLLGVGTGMFGRVYREYRVFGGVYDNRLGTAHNAYLNTFAETGIVGAALLIAFGVVIVRAFWRRRRALGAAGQGRTGVERLRLEGAFAALLGFGVQSLFDTFVITPLALLTAVLVVLVVVEPGTVVGPVRRLRWAAPALALLIAIYGAGQVVSDSLYGQFRAAESLDQVQAVAAADPHMGVYGLGAAVLRHRAGDPDADAAYAAALESAPTWDAGWINRAALAEMRGDDAAALAYLDRARAIDRFNGAALHYARIAERTGAGDHADLVDAYRLGFDYLNLPLSEFWGETPARREAVGSLAAAWTPGAPDLAYRLLRVHAPEQIAALTAAAASHDPPQPGDWWVLGEEALRGGDAAAAFDWMDRAARAARTNGDYYASRARARLALDPADPLIEIDLRLAELLGARYESPNAIRAEIAPDEETRRRLWANAVPPLVVAQNFEGVGYAGRGVGFWIAPSMRPPGVGLAVLQPWVALAESYAAAGEVEAAEAVRRAIAERQ